MMAGMSSDDDWIEKLAAASVEAFETGRELRSMFEASVARFQTDPVFHHRVKLLARILEQDPVFAGFDEKARYEICLGLAVQAIVAIEQMDGGILDGREL
jgi:hypothetical protein